MSQNAPDCISAHVHFKTFPRGACPQIPTGTLAYYHTSQNPHRTDGAQIEIPPLLSLKKELHMGNLTAACYENKRVLKVINTITMVTVLLWLRTLLTSPCGGLAPMTGTDLRFNNF